jgi:hypothetical protein
MAWGHDSSRPRAQSGDEIFPAIDDSARRNKTEGSNNLPVGGVDPAPD